MYIKISSKPNIKATELLSVYFFSVLFFSDAEELSVNRDLSENIGVVVFGTKTEVLSPLTVDYSAILENICKFLYLCISISV